MSATQPDVVASAKQGNPKAIAALMSRSLKSKGIDVKAFNQGQRLNIFLESAEVPPQQALVAYTRKGIEGLGIQTIKTVRVHGRQTGSDLPAWAEEFNLSTYVQPAIDDSGTIVVASKVVHPIQKSQTTPATPRRVSVVSSQSKRSIPWIPIVAGGFSAVVLLSAGGLTFWARSAQSSAIAQSKELLKLVGQSENPGDIEALKGDQENLQESIDLLQAAPQLPLLNIGEIKAELDKAETQLAEVDESIQSYEALIPEIQSTLDQLAAMDSGLDVGINYRDYGAEVRELKVAVDRLGRQPGAKEHLVYKDIETAYEHYEFAYNVWNYYIESDETHSFFPADSSYGALLISSYKVEPTDIVGYKKIYLNSALSKVWEAASQSVEAAQTKL